MREKRLLIVDGNSLMYRAFYGLPLLTNSEGIPTNAIYGLASMLLKMKEDIKPDFIATAFDKKAPTFRHLEYKEYKAGRKKMPEELAQQIPYIRELLEAFGVSIFEIEGFEADDLIGTLAVHAEENGMEVYIVTGDRDALQLASDNIKVVINKKGMTEVEIYDRDRMIEEYGVTPQEFIDVKGLMGDKSDNIPGVPGVGEKTAYKLIKEYKSVENVLMNIDSIKGKKLKENLTTYSEQALFSKKLATIMINVPVEINLEEMKGKDEFDSQKLKEMFYRFQFKSLIKKFGTEINGEESSQQNIEVENNKAEFEKINTINELKKFVKELKGEIYFTYDVKDEKLISTIELQNLYVQNQGKNYSIDIDAIYREDVEQLKEAMEGMFNGEDHKLIGHNVKYLYICLKKIGVNFRCVDFDSEIAAYIIDPGKKEYTLETLIEGYLLKGAEGDEEENKITRTSMLKDVYGILNEKIISLEMEELLYNVELPLTIVIADMECEGFQVDSKRLSDLGEKFQKRIKSLEKDIYGMADEEFNIKSPKQLGKILFEKLDLPVIKKTKTGYSTNAEVLEALRDKHLIIDKILNYRQITKLDSTYVEGLKSVIDKDGRIHSSLNQTVTTTGRLSSTEPNLQNIPIRHEMGREIRKVFVTNDENCSILSADYSQIELRVLAHIAGDENLIDAFVNHSDIHTKTASEVFGVPMDEVTPLMRSNAKAVNFGIVYGIGDFSLAKDLHITRKEAKKYIETYFSRYPNVKKYLDDIVETAKKDGEVKTILNRRRFIPELASAKKMMIAFGERLAMNTPIQGSAADIIKLAMVNVYKELKNRDLKSKIILQVHDELILNVYNDELEEVKELIKREMENVRELKVPMEVDMSIGETWYDAK